MSNLTNIGARWTKDENDQLIRLYNEEELNILEIAKIHKRAPGGILARLVMNKIINEKEEARGYDEFISNKDIITKEVKDVYKDKMKEKKEKEIEKEEILISRQEYIELKNELKDIKNLLNVILGKLD
jgi:hypothetical protein